MEARYDVRVTKDFLVFSSAHFITFAGGRCERLHGHNYRVEVVVHGALDENHYVVDFLALRDFARAVVDRLDHRVLLPTQSSLILVEQREGQTVARCQERAWSFPADECILLPLPNTTTELLARWIGEQIVAALEADAGPRPSTLVVNLEENFGQWAGCTLQLR